MASLHRALTAALLALALLAGPLAAPHADAASQPARRAASVKDSPGYYPPSDADSTAEQLGRRADAPTVRMPFAGGARSMKELGEAVLGALHAEDADSLLRLCVTPDEFRVILWPEFPQSRPATGLAWDDAWPVLNGRLNGGSLGSVRELGGHYYTLLRVETASVAPYKNFKLHNGVTVVARDDEGREVRYTTVRSVAERRGRFKIYSMYD
jgi:hypothetical protein